MMQAWRACIQHDAASSRLGTGARITMISQAASADAAQLAEVLVAQRVTHMAAVPRVWQSILPHLAAHLAAGEPCLPWQPPWPLAPHPEPGTGPAAALARSPFLMRTEQ